MCDADRVTVRLQVTLSESVAAMFLDVAVELSEVCQKRHALALATGAVDEAERLERLLVDMGRDMLTLGEALGLDPVAPTAEGAMVS